MSDVFGQYLAKEIGLNEEMLLHIRSKAVARQLRRNEQLLMPGDICRHKVFVLKGLLRTYSVSDGGNEIILQFSPELNWTLDAESYDQLIPSRYYISAVESSEVLLWHKNDFDRLLADFPALKKYAEQLISRNIYSSRQRLQTALGATPEEKYEEFVRTNPLLLARLPLRMIAAYLGISLKTLTRIRHEQWAR